MTRRSFRTGLALTAPLLTVLALQGCKDAGTIQTLQIDATGAINGIAYLDNNGNGTFDQQDKPMPSAPVVLMAGGGTQVVQETTADTTGVFSFQDIPVGTYRLGLDTAALGDSLEAQGADKELTVKLDSVARQDLPISYPVLTLAEVRASAAGRRVFTSGIALNPRQSYGDGEVHLQSDTSYLRAINVERANLNTGDSVRMLGRVEIDQGEPVLDNVTPFVLVSAATVPIPRDITTEEAATAEGGSLDAGLIRINKAEISDTVTENGNFHFQANDGTGQVEVVLRSFLQLSTASIRPDTIVRISTLTGLLTPTLDQTTGQVTWHILPRGGGDVGLEIKYADLGVGVSVDKPSVSKGDTVTFTVVLTNAGPAGASGVEVKDTIPTGLTFVSATAARGTYDSGTGVWSIDSVQVADTDTLTIRANVTTDLLGQTVDRAAVTKLAREVDPSPGNNTATTVVSIVARTASPPASPSLVGRSPETSGPPPGPDRARRSRLSKGLSERSDAAPGG